MNWEHLRRPLVHREPQGTEMRAETVELKALLNFGSFRLRICAPGFLVKPSFFGEILRHLPLSISPLDSEWHFLSD